MPFNLSFLFFLMHGLRNLFQTYYLRAVLQFLMTPTLLLRRQYEVDKISELKERDKVLDGLGCLSYNERVAQFIRGSTRHSIKNDTTVVDFRPLYAVSMKG